MTTRSGRAVRPIILPSGYVAQCYLAVTDFRQKTEKAVLCLILILISDDVIEHCLF